MLPQLCPRELAPVAPQHGYDVAASAYASWHWTHFWRVHETPIVQEWLTQIKCGLGLDAGCGMGRYRETATSVGHRYVGLDISFRMLTWANAERRGRERVQGDLTALPCAADAFDWILSTRVLSHCASPRNVFAEWGRVLKAGGQCLLIDVHPAHPYEHMSLHVGDETVVIQTFKHQPSAVVAAARAAGFIATSCKQFRLEDLSSAPSRTRFGKLYAKAEAPIFYAVTLEKSRQKRSSHRGVNLVASTSATV